MDFIKQELTNLRNNALYRTLKTIDGSQSKKVIIDGKEYLSFCSNNYLDIANHPAITAAVIDAVKKYGWGAGASMLVSGNMTLHKQLEKEIAQFKKTEDSIVFPTGFMANVGTISSIVGNGDLIISDRLNHASIVEGSKLSKATFRVYAHCDIVRLEKILKRAKGFRRILIVTDSVFSMDGDIAPLKEIFPIAEEYNAMVMVDEAHATGVFGESGRGVLESLGLEHKADIVMGTLSKAVGGMGGFVCGNHDLVNYLRNKAKSFIYTTALPPAVCAAALAGLKLIKKSAELRTSLWKNINYFRERLNERKINCGNSQGPIIPIIIGDLEKTNHIAEILFENGILAPAIRPPTVPRGSSRIRVTIMSSHTKEDIDKFITILFNVTI